MPESDYEKMKAAADRAVEKMGLAVKIINRLPEVLEMIEGGRDSAVISMLDDDDIIISRFSDVA